MVFIDFYRTILNFNRTTRLFITEHQGFVTYVTGDSDLMI